MTLITKEGIHVMKFFHAIENMLSANSNGKVALKEATLRFFDDRTGNYDEMNWSSDMTPKEWVHRIKDDLVIRNRFEEENTKHRRELGENKNDD